MTDAAIDGDMNSKMMGRYFQYKMNSSGMLHVLCMHTEQNFNIEGTRGLKLQRIPRKLREGTLYSLYIYVTWSKEKRTVTWKAKSKRQRQREESCTKKQYHCY